MTSPLMLFAGGRVGDFIANGVIYEQGPGAGTFDTAWSDCSTNVAAGVTVTCNFTDASGAAITVGAGYTIAAHAWIGFARGIISGPLLTFYNAANQPWMRINSPSNGSAQLQYNSGTGASPTWTNLGPAQTAGWGDFDISFKIDASGTHTALFAIAGSTVYTGTFTSANLAATSIAYFTVFNSDPGATLYLSQCMGSRDIVLVLAKLKTLRATGAGTYSQWTGAFGNVNEASTNDSTYDVSTTVGQKQSYAMTDVAVPAQYSITSVFYKVRARNDGGVAATQNVDALARSGGTDYVSGALTPIAAAYGYMGTRYDVDPATGVAWTQSGVNALELGYQSAP